MYCWINGELLSPFSKGLTFLMVSIFWNNSLDERQIPLLSSSVSCDVVYEGGITSIRSEKDVIGLGMSAILKKIATVEKQQGHYFYLDICFRKFWFDEKSIGSVKYI